MSTPACVSTCMVAFTGLVAATAATAQSGRPAGAGWFVDVTEALGLPLPRDRAGGNYMMPEVMMGGCTLFDYDGDGALDLYLPLGVFEGSEVAHGADARNRLYRQLPDGTFADVTEAAGVGDPGYGMMGLAGDYDDDGDADLYVTNFGRDVLYRNNGDGTFTDVTEGAGLAGPDEWSTAAGFFDLDDDGDLDLYVVTYVTLDRSRRTTDDAGAPEYPGPSVYPPTPDRYWRNHGDGTFSEASVEIGISTTAGRGLGLAFVDLDQDGRTDVYVANDGEPNFAWVRDGVPTTGGLAFRERALEMGLALDSNGRPQASMGIALGDLDADGRDELFLTHLGLEANTLYREVAPGTWEDGTLRSGLGIQSLERTGFGVALVDVELDGDVDVLIANGRVHRAAPVPGSDVLPEHWRAYGERNALYLNDGVGRFTLAETQAGDFAADVGLGRALATGDVDRDGDIDVVVADGRGGVRVFRNEAPRVGRPVLIEVRDASGRIALGTTATVIGADGTQRRRIEPSDSYLASSERLAHFGVAEDGPIAVVINWRDGVQERFEGVRPGQRATVRRGRGLVDADPVFVARAAPDAPVAHPLPALPVLVPCARPQPDTEGREPPVVAELGRRLAEIDAHPDCAAAWGVAGGFLEVHDWSSAARTCYEQAMRLEPENPLWPHLMALHISTEDPELALAYGRRAVEQNPNYAPLRIFVARRLLDRGDLDQAAAEVDAAVRIDPNSIAARVELSRVALARGDLDGAITACERAIALGARADGVHATLAEAYRRRGDLEAARRHRALVDRQMRLEVIGDHIRANALANLGVSNAWSRRRAEEALARGDMPEAIRQWERAVEAWPENVLGYVQLARVYWEAQRWADVIAAADRALALDADEVVAEALLGGALARTGRVAEAVPHLETYAEAMPDVADPHRVLGRAYRDLGRTGAALDAFRRAIEIEPDGPTHLDAGALLARAGDIDAAEPEFRRAIEVDPTLARAYSNLARIAIRRGRAAEALAWLERGAQAAPADRMLRNELALFLAGPPDPGLRDLPRAHEIAHATNEQSGFSDPQSLVALATILEAQGNLPEARRWLERAIEVLAPLPQAAATHQALVTRLARMQ